MRILIHGINFSPELTGIGKYSGEMAQWLAAQGHEVRVVTAPPYYPQWQVAGGFVNWWSEEKANPPHTSLEKRGAPSHTTTFDNEGGGLVVYRCPLWVPAKPSGLKRVLHLASFALSSFPIMLRQIFWKPDVVWVVEPPLFCAPQAWLVARLSGGKAWLHVQDYEVDAAFDLGLLKGAALRSLVTVCERWLMRRFDRVSTISQRMLDRALAKGVMPERVVMFRNWVDLDAFASAGMVGRVLPAMAKPGFRAELGIAADAVVALYSGSMGGKQGLEILAQAARICRSDFNTTGEYRVKTRPAHDIVFVFCGNGAGRADLVALCDGLSNVRFLEMQPLERLSELLAMADIHLLPQRADAADLVMPSKLTGMLASGRPVVATANAGTELASVVADCGLVVPPEKPKEFADAVALLANDVALRTRLGAAGRAYAEENLGRDAVLGGVESEIVKLSAEKESVKG